MATIGGYQIVEYIESSGTQYIDTGIAPGSYVGRLKIEADMAFSSTPTGSSTYSVLFGAGYYNSTATNRRQILVGYRGATSTSKPSYMNAGGSLGDGVKAFSDATLDANRHIYGIDQVNSNFIFDDKTQSFSTSVSSTLTRNLLIFASEQSSSSGSPVGWYSSAKCYGFKIYDGDTLLRDFVPVRNGSVGGLYDKVSETLFTNSGTGSFTLGADAYEVSVSVEPEGWGYVEGVGYYAMGSVARLIAKPIGKHDFLEWSDGYDYYDYTIAVEGDIHLVVYFIERTAVLPKGYKPLNCVSLANTSGFYMDTGVVASSSLDIEAKFRTTSQSYVFGARNTNSNTSAGQFWASLSETEQTNTAQFGYNNAQTTYSLSAQFVQKKHTELSLAGAEYAKQVSLTSAEFEGTRTLYVFARNNAGAAQQSSEGYVSFYRMRIWEDGVLVRDYVPAYEEHSERGVIYDLVNDTTWNGRSSPYYLPVASSEGGHGKVNSEIFGLVDGIYIDDNYLFDDPIRLKAIPEKGYVFDHWEDSNGVNISNEEEFWYKYTYQNDEVTAIFKKKSKTQNNGYRLVALPYGKGYDDYRAGQESSKHTDIYSGVLTASIKEDIMQRTSSTIELKDDVQILNDTALFVYDPRGKLIFCGVAKSNENGILEAAEPLSILDSDFILDNGTDITQYRLDAFLDALVFNYMNGRSSFTNYWDDPATTKKCFPFFSTFDQVLLADAKRNYIVSPPAVEETSVINLEDYILDLANAFIVVFKPTRTTKELYVPDVGLLNYDVMELKVANPYIMDKLTIGSNSEEFSNLTITKEGTDETFNVLAVFNSAFTDSRAYYAVSTEGDIIRPGADLAEVVEPAKRKIVLSDDSLKTLRDQYLSSGILNHKITFDVDLTKGTFRLNDFELGRPVDFYDGTKLYQTMVTAREYEITMDSDDIKSVKVTLGKTRTNLTSKLNLRKSK